MPSLARTGFMLSWAARFTLGKETLLVSVPGWPDARREVIAPRAAAAGKVQPAEPAGGSSASIASLPPRYGSQTAVQPSEVTVRYRPPSMNCAVTGRPAAVVNGPGPVSFGSNGATQAACM